MGDFPGHPFRGNQYSASSGQGYDERIGAAKGLKVGDYVHIGRSARIDKEGTHSFGEGGRIRGVTRGSLGPNDITYTIGDARVPLKMSVEGLAQRGFRVFPAGAKEEPVDPAARVNAERTPPLKPGEVFNKETGEIVRTRGVSVSRGDYLSKSGKTIHDKDGELIAKVRRPGIDNRGMPDRSGKGRSYAQRVYEARTRALRKGK